MCVFDVPSLFTSRRSEDRKLSTSTGKVQLLAADSSVVDESCNIDIIITSLTSLVIGAEAPAVSLALSVDCEGVVTASGNSNSLDTWNDNWNCNHARVLALIKGHVLFGDLGDIDTKLTSIGTAPCEKLAIISARN